MQRGDAQSLDLFGDILTDINEEKFVRTAGWELNLDLEP